MSIAGLLFPKNALGRLNSALLHRMGADELARKSSRRTGYVPAIVKIDISSDVRMQSEQGNDHIVREIWEHGLDWYEPPLPAVFLHLVSGASCVLDVGTNSGLYALLAAAQNPRTIIHAFEPFPEAVRVLRSNLAANPTLAERIILHEVAAGEAAGSFKLYVPQKRWGNTLETSCSLESNFRPAHDRVIDVRVVPIDDHVARHSIERVSLIRADVEGAEYRVVAGARETLRTHRPWVLLEVLSAQAAERLKPELAATGYACFAMDKHALLRLRDVEAVRGASNQLWAPPERIDELASLLSRAGLGLELEAR